MARTVGAEIAHSRARIAALALAASRDARGYTRKARMANGCRVEPVSATKRTDPVELARRRRALKRLEQARADHEALRIRLGLTSRKESRPARHHRRATLEVGHRGTSTARTSSQV